MVCLAAELQQMCLNRGQGVSAACNNAIGLFVVAFAAEDILAGALQPDIDMSGRPGPAPSDSLVN